MPKGKRYFLLKIEELVKCLILLDVAHKRLFTKPSKIEERGYFNHGDTESFSRINPPKVGGGLKFESHADIGGKKSLRAGTHYPAAICSHRENVTADSMVQMESAATANSSSPFISFAII